MGNGPRARELPPRPQGYFCGYKFPRHFIVMTNTGLVSLG
jgi:hypothetical protein